MTNSKEKGPFPGKTHDAEAADNLNETDPDLSLGGPENPPEQIDKQTDASEIDSDQLARSAKEELVQKNIIEDN